MPTVTIALNGRNYDIACGEGEEARVQELAGELRRRMEGLAKNAESVRHGIADAFGGKLPLGVSGFEDLARQNVQMFQRALKMFSPFGRFGRGSDAPAEPEGAESPKAADPDEISDLKAQLDAMKKQLDTLANRTK